MRRGRCIRFEFVSRNGGAVGDLQACSTRGRSDQFSKKMDEIVCIGQRVPCTP